MKRIKGVRQKQNGAYPTFVPLGTDGQFIDMISDLNLEYELKLGVKHVANITRDEYNEDITYILEYYATPQEVQQGGTFYSVETTIDGTGHAVAEPDWYATDDMDAKLYWVTLGSGGEEISKKFIRGKHTEIWVTTITSANQDPYSNYKIYETYIDEEE